MKKIGFYFLVVVFGGFGGILADRFLFPYLSTVSFFSKYDIVRKAAQDVTIINKTEQVTVKEEFSIEKVINQVSSSLVNIVSASKNETISKKEAALIKNGTGMIVTSDGIIMTYASALLKENSTYQVFLFDGNVKEAKLLGIDSYSNLAFLKIEASNLPTISFANSEDAKIGEKIVALSNNSLDYSNNYTTSILGGWSSDFNLFGGKVSSSEKMEGVFKDTFTSKDEYVGGPVVDYLGQVIGVTGVVESGPEKTYFQIPANKIKRVLDKVLQNRLEQNPYLGIYFLPANKTYLTLGKITRENGALVYSASGQQGLAIIAGSPAQKAGLKIGDMLIALNGEEINKKNTLPDLLYKYKKGDTIELTLIRNEQEMKIEVNL